jgi:hypothetical protein
MILLGIELEIINIFYIIYYIQMSFEEKYLKYTRKYLDLSEQYGSAEAGGGGGGGGGGDSKFTTKLNEFFDILAEYKHISRIEDPPTFNVDTFMRTIQSYHARLRAEERVKITEENIRSFQAALRTTKYRCFFNSSRKIFKYLDAGVPKYYHFSIDLQEYIKIDDKFSEYWTKVEYPTMENAYDDARLIHKVYTLRKEEVSRMPEYSQKQFGSIPDIPEDFEKQITQNKCYYLDNKRALIMYVNNTTFWKIILNPDFSRIVTILQDGNAASLYYMFTKNKLKKPIKIVGDRKAIPKAWLEGEEGGGGGGGGGGGEGEEGEEGEEGGGGGGGGGGKPNPRPFRECPNCGKQFSSSSIFSKHTSKCKPKN